VADGKSEGQIRICASMPNDMVCGIETMEFEYFNNNEETI
jgi:hypothetical protein